MTKETGWPGGEAEAEAEAEGGGRRRVRGDDRILAGLEARVGAERDGKDDVLQRWMMSRCQSVGGWVVSFRSSSSLRPSRVVQKETWIG